jgi:glycosyltransferase involved in cell wall biosynthesis
LSSRLLIVSFSVCPAPDRHGVQLVNVLKALAPRYTVDVLTLRAGTMPFQERFMKTRMLRVPVVGMLGEQVEAFRRAIRRQLEGEEYDAIHLRSAWGGRAVLTGGPGARLVYEIARSTEGEPRAANAALADALAAEEQVCVSRAALILAPTEAARAHLAARGMGDKVVVVPPGVDVDHFDWEPPDDEDPPRVLYAGQIAGGRGVRLLLRAVAKLRRRRPVKLVLAGAVEEGFQQVLDEASFEAGLGPEDMESLGAIDHDDMPRVIAQAMVCVAPSAPDAAERPLASFPSKLLEYMACRRPVVAPRRPPVTEVISDGENGLLFSNGDAADLARCIGRILDDAELRARLSEAAYERVRRDHPASATRRRILEAYTRLFPASSWTPPSAAVAPINALPSHPDTTTARRPMPQMLVDGRAEGERSGEIIIDPVTPSQTVTMPELPTTVTPTEIVIEMEALTEEEMLQEALAESFADGAVTQKIVVASAMQVMADADTQAIDLRGQTFASDGPDEKTTPGPLRPRKRSG